MERYFYFGGVTVETTGNACMFPLSSFLGMTPGGSDSIKMHFKSRNGAATDDIVVVTQSSSDVKLLMQELTAVLSNPRGGFFVQSDFVGNNAPKADGFISGVSGIVITTAA